MTYATRDGGLTYERNAQTFTLTNFQLHPSQKEWVLTLLNGNLLLSKDLGRTWKTIFNKVRGYDWCFAGLGTIPATRICLIADVPTP